METSFSGSEGSQDLSGQADRAEMHGLMMEETSFSGSEDSQNLSGELLSDYEYCGPMDLPCKMCSHFLFTEFKLARDHKAQFERILAEPGQQGLSERAKLHMKNCCLGFYAGLDDVVGGK